MFHAIITGATLLRRFFSVHSTPIARTFHELLGQRDYYLASGCSVLIEKQSKSLAV
jgi:hypothetical protein